MSSRSPLNNFPSVSSGSNLCSYSDTATASATQSPTSGLTDGGDNSETNSTSSTSSTRTTRTTTTTSTRTTASTTRTTTSTVFTPTSVVTTATVVTPTVIIITPSFAQPTTITTTVVVVTTGTSVSTPTSTRDSSSNSGGFFDNKGAVGGVFAVVAILIALLIAGLVWLLMRRRRQKQMDADVMAAASAAAAHSRTPFDYDDDDDDPEMIEGPNSYPPRVPTPGAGTAYGAQGTIGSSYGNHKYGPEGYEPSHFSAGTQPGYAGMGAYGPTMGAAGAAAGAGAGAAAGAYGAYYAGQAHDGNGNDPYGQHGQQQGYPEQHNRQTSYGGSAVGPGQPWGVPASTGSPPPGSPPMDPNVMPNPYAGYGQGAGPSPPLGPTAEEGAAGAGVASGSSHQYLHAGPTGAGGVSPGDSHDTAPTALSDGAPGSKEQVEGDEDDDAVPGRPDPRFMLSNANTGSQASLRDDHDYSRRLGL